MQPEQPLQPQTPQMPPAPTPQPEPQPTQPTMPQPPIMQPVQPQSGAPEGAPIYQADCWIVPKGHRTTLSYKHSRATVTPGWVTIKDIKTGEEYARYQLTPDLEMGRMFGWARFKKVNGQRMSFFDIQAQVMLSDIKAFWLILAGAGIELISNAIYLSSDGTVSRYNMLYLLGFALGIAGLVWHFAQAKRAKDFVAACKRGAGIA
jgi:hypothetical protein